MYCIDTINQALSTAKAYEHNLLDESFSLIDIDAIWLLSLVYLLTLPTVYWLHKLNKRPYKSRFIANSSSCTTNELSIILTACLTAIKNHVIQYCETVLRGMVISIWSIKNSGEILNKLKSKGFLASSVPTSYLSTLYTTLRHNLIKEKLKLTEIIEQTFNREGSLCLACSEKCAFFVLLLNSPKYLNCGIVRKFDALHYLLDNMFYKIMLKIV